MATYTVEDSSLVSVANAIRLKTNSTNKMKFPSEYVSAINAIQTGGVRYTDKFTEWPDDDNSHFWVSVSEVPLIDGNEVSIVINNEEKKRINCTIYWGDQEGTSSAAILVNGFQTFSHSYTTGGVFEIIIDSDGGNYSFEYTPPVGERSGDAVQLVAACIGSRCKNNSDGSKELSDKLFSDSYGLRSVRFPNIVTKIPYQCFFNCTSMNDVSIPTKIVSIEDSAFYECQSLNYFLIPESCRYIKENAFNKCYSLFRIDIYSNNITINKSAFFAAFIDELHIYSSNPPTLIEDLPDESGFDWTIHKIYVPKNAKSIYIGNTSWSKYSSIIYEEPD